MSPRHPHRRRGPGKDGTPARVQPASRADTASGHAAGGYSPYRSEALAELAAVGLILVVTFIAYANAWPDALIHDDKFFGGAERFAGLTDWSRPFREDLWSAAGIESGLYRPLLLLSLALDARLFGDWLPGYHLVNILLHTLATLLVYGLVRLLLRKIAPEGSAVDSRYALLAALVFAVHPIHTEVVNSIYNRSEILVTLFGATGLWWLLTNLDTRPARGWLGFGFCYLLAMFSRETGAVLPGLAVALILLLEPGPWTGRVRKCLPVLWLLLPLILFMWLRGQALAPSLSVESTAGDTGEGTFGLLTSASLPGLRTVLDTAGVMGLSLKLMVWPQPLLVYRSQLPRAWEWGALLLHGTLITLAIVNYRRKRYGLILGLAFFYVAFLPSSRLFGLGPGTPHLAERYLYFPSVGPTLLLALALQSLGLRMGFKTTLAPVVLALALMTPLVWARNAQWSSEIRLFEADLANGGRDAQLLRVLSGAYLDQGNNARAVDICERHPPRVYDERYANHCGIAYGQAGMTEKAIQAYSIAIGSDDARATAHANLARLYLRQNRRSEAAEHLQLAVEAEKHPARRAYRAGIMIVRLYPSDRARLLEAREHFAEAVRLQPQMASARQWLQRIDDYLAGQQRPQ